jgi:hypothetical protein
VGPPSGAAPRTLLLAISDLRDSIKKAQLHFFPKSAFVEAAGIEPAVDFDPSVKLVCGCVICEECLAAMALHSDGTNWLELALTDADLESVIRAWKGLAEPIRRAVRALLGSPGL